jgi:capsular exopolysaccharide synthesis family protein
MHRLPGQGMNELDAYRPHQQAMGYPAVPPVAPPSRPADQGSDGPLQLMWRRRWIVVMALLVCIFGAVAYLRVATPLYTSTARLTVSGDVLSVLGGGGTKADPAIDFMAAQLALMTSGPVAERALRDFDTTKMETFADVKDPVAYLRKYLVVEPGRKDGTFLYTFDAPSAKESAELLNAMIKAYIEDRSESDPILNVMYALENQQKALEAKLDKLTKEQADFRLKNGGLSFETKSTSNVVVEKLNSLNNALTQQENLLIQKRVEYATRNDKQRAYQELLVVEGTARQLRAAYEAQEKLAIQLNEKTVEYDMMGKQVVRTEAVLAEVQARLNEVRSNLGNKAWTVRVLENASLPTKPGKPEKAKILALAIVAGLMLGFGGAWVREKTDHRLSSADEIAQILGLPVLSLIPSMPGRSGAVTRGQKVHLESMSDVAEAFRTLRTVVYFSVPEGKAKTILLTSPFQGEGKSTTASGLAIAMAKAGRRTLMIDGDLRKPTLHRIFELSDQVGLSSVMAGKESLEKAVQRTAVEGLDVLPCGPIPANPSEILNSRAFAEMLQKLASKYDHIVLDSPPVLPVTDARILGATCDVTLLVLRANRSTRRMSEYAAEAMLGVGARVLGVVVNDVPRSKRSGYQGGYGYGNYGYGKRNYEIAQQPQQTANGNAMQKRLPSAEAPAA